MTPMTLSQSSEEGDGKIYVMGGDVTKDANLSEIYDPVTDEWRTLQPFRPKGQREREVVFVAKGKLYCMTHQSIDVYDMDTNSWTQLHSNSFDEFGHVDSLVVVPLAVVAVDDELLAIVVFTDRDEEHIETSLVRSRGFRSDIKETVWRKAQPSLSFPPLGPIAISLRGRTSWYTVAAMQQLKKTKEDLTSAHLFAIISCPLGEGNISTTALSTSMRLLHGKCTGLL
ncbi:unnamed protein product [Calypogeia fissa]